MWRWGKMENIKWPEKVDNVVLKDAGEKRMLQSNILRRKDICVGHIQRRNSLLRHAIKEQMTEVKGLRRIRRRCWELKEEAEDGKRWKQHKEEIQVTFR